MTDPKGPITLITSLSDERNKWKSMTYAWKAVALQAVPPCVDCGGPSVWGSKKGQGTWCEVHGRELAATDNPTVEKLPWYITMLQALDLEDRL
ncbi:MAG: hypothetical protein OEY63_06835 [Gemmatimonadota bacterium]|nr:hypothetical protein [Gemmatimonadota bacterium]